ncbi:sodium/hydrogen exchanger [Cellulomonas chitinilytica]|uniref:Sodium/hydrogen exchanger n=1 Tax=Cellulomonas chitinilytica TaxID=398759 RepID=A0A919U3F5_9CELL|nr:hypothetical protein [Cellulomonas chitinilytica]GIG23256.1 sodium/hydrogen exchanger [Cellulomonas chitinilytica]
MLPVIEFVLGVALLVYSAEKLIGHLVGVASRWAVSLFLVAVVFTGVELDDLAYGVVVNVEGQEQVALGSVIGTSIAMTGIVLALAALVAPSRVEVPRDYLVLFVAGPVAMFVLALTGVLTLAVGVVLVVLFLAFVAWVAVREHASRRPVFRNADLYEELEKVGAGSTSGPARLPEAPRAPAGAFELPADLRVDQAILRARRRSAPAGLALAAVALAGLVVGSVVAGRGTGGVLETFGIDGTVFGVTIATLALSLEDVFLTVEPARRGVPEIGIANVVGSVVFSVTGKLGIVLLAGGAITVDRTVLTWHLPVLLVMTALAAVFLATGRLRRWHGGVLLGSYVVYFVVSLVAFGGVPLDD